MSWHVTADDLTRYAGGDAAASAAFSLEAHVVGCEACRAQVAGRFPADPLERVWAGVLEAIDPQPARRLERVLRGFGVSDHVARLLAATPSLSVSWLSAVMVVLAFAVAAAYAGPGGRVLFLVVAPLVPLAGVAAAYGPGIDPTYEVALAAPIRGQRLLLIRAVAAVGAAMAMTGIAALALPGLDWTAAAWLLPALALSVGGLAVSSAWPSLWVFAGIGGAWVAGVAATQAFAATPGALFGPPAQLAYVALGAASLCVLGARRAIFDSGRVR
ncbi:MAG TPA: zf-HC2 domain-containing protein [Actinomycetota bacterium]|nr:zf-HC2 domain-containing protein [Actinomycetota bacterium]